MRYIISIHIAENDPITSVFKKIIKIIKKYFVTKNIVVHLIY